MPSQHSWWSPSAASRSIPCPGSVKACEPLKGYTNADAEAGTTCHAFMEAYYKGEDPEPIRAAFKLTWQEATIELCCEQTDSYLTELITLNGDPEVTLESQLVFSWDNTVFGTCDLILWFPLTSHLVIGDYKFGMGEVFAQENEQLLTYASAALELYPDALTVELCIIQPRVKRPESWVTSAEAVREWEEKVLKPAVEAAKDPNALRIPGAKQCKWCEYGRRAGCDEAAVLLMDDLLKLEEGNQIAANDSMSIEEVTDYVTTGHRAAALSEVFDALMLNRLKAGEKSSEYKLVRRDTHLTWEDQEKADKKLSREGLTQEQRYTRKLISPSQAKKLLDYKGKTASQKKAFDAYIVKPEGELTFAPISDKRPEAVNLEVPKKEETATPEVPIEAAIADLF